MEQNLKILVVDDEEDSLLYVKEILEKANFKVLTAKTGYEAIEYAKNNKPALIILDIVLPDLDGATVASRLSLESSTSNIPIIFLTGILKKEEEQVIKKTGKHYILAKPVISEELLSLIKKITEK